MTKRLLQREKLLRNILATLGPEMFELLGPANKSISAQIHLKHHQSKLKNLRDQLLRPLDKHEEGTQKSHLPKVDTFRNSNFERQIVPFNTPDQIEIIEKLFLLSVCEVRETKISIQHVIKFADSVLTFSFISTTFYCLETTFNFTEIDVIHGSIKLNHAHFNERRLKCRLTTEV